MQLIQSLTQSKPELQAIRHRLHAHPELRFEEHRTADLVASTLTGWGIEVHRGLAGTGVVGVIRSKRSGRTIGLRADMDALPIQETNTFSHRSQLDGRMHACGHDGHTAMLLAAARHLSASRSFDGTVVLIFQPAEEGGAGADRMIREGLFERFDCDAVFALHNWPGLGVGRFAVAPGPMLASTNEFAIRITGRGGHAAMPHLTVDPVLVAAQIVQALQGIVTRARNPIDSAVLSVTMIHAGDATNVIPDVASIGGTVRTFDDAVTDLFERQIRQIAELTARAHGASAAVDFQRTYPPTVNHPVQAELAARVADGIVGVDNVVRNVDPTLGAEDFSFMLRARPGAYLFIGNGDGAHRDAGHGAGPCTLHNASYDFNDELIPIGGTFWVRLAEEFLR
jgi:hippurate hydrolase